MTCNSSLRFVPYCKETAKINKSAVTMCEIFNDSEKLHQNNTHIKLSSTRVDCV